jgi:hypothetical protein
MELSLRVAAFWLHGSPLEGEGIASASEERWLRNDILKKWTVMHSC